MTSRRLGEATGHSSVLESFFVSWLTGEGPFSVHQRELFLCPVWRIKLLPDTKEQVKEISLISEGQHNSVLRRLAFSGCRSTRTCQSPLEGAGTGAGLGRGRIIGSFPRSPIGPSELRPHQPRWATPRGGHSQPQNALRGASLGAAGPSATGTARPLCPASSGSPGALTGRSRRSRRSTSS